MKIMEQFKQIQGFPDYQIGEFGTIKSFKHGLEKVLRPILGTNGYLQLKLYTVGSMKRVMLHRLVALHFIPNPENKPTVNHLDGDKLNCKKSNLEWSTQLENNQHAIENGLNKVNGANNPNAKLTPEQVQEIINLKGQKSCREIGLLFNVSKGQVSKLQNGKQW